MNATQTDYSLGQDRAWEKKIELSSPGESEWIIIPEKVKFIPVTVSFTGGATGKMQTSTDLVYDIKTGSPVPIDWPYGLVAINQTKVCLPVAGMRAVQVGTGTMKVTMRAQ